MKYGLKETTITAICNVLARYPQVDQAVLYGSRAKGNFENGSDIDLTLLGGEDLTLNLIFRISDEIDDLLLPYKIDLSIYKDIENQALIDHIRRVGEILYQRKSQKKFK